MLDVKFDSTSEVRKRRSIGCRTDRDTWVRIEIRDLARVDGQGWGVESASVLEGVSMPAWYQGLTWIDHELGVMWRVDETGLISEQVVIPAGFLTTEPDLPESWWATFNASLNALAAHPTTRRSTPGLKPLTPARFTDTIQTFFPEVEATITEWTAAHADLGWPNLTTPVCYFLDWEDWGMAPRGFDAATLRTESLAVPALAERIYQERQSDLDSRTGQLAQLYHCAKLMSAPASRSGPLLEPAKALARELLTALEA
jgi:hypothetical protein